MDNHTLITKIGITVLVWFIVSWYERTYNPIGWRAAFVLIAGVACWMVWQPVLDAIK